MNRRLLYKNGASYHCLLENYDEQLSGYGDSSKEALENWVHVFRQCVKKIRAHEVSDYVRQLKATSSVENPFA